MDMAIEGLAEEHQILWQSVHDFVNDVIKPFIKEDPDREWNAAPEDRVPRKIFEAVDKLGIRCIGVPEKFGGVEVDPTIESLVCTLVAMELARGDCGLADKLIQTWKLSVLIRTYASERIQEEWFPEIVADPTFLMGHAVSEPRGSSDRWLPYNVPESNMDTKAVFDNGEWVLNGVKHFITNGYDGNLFIVYANTNSDVGVLEGTSSFVVPRDTPGVSIARCNETIGARLMNNGEIVLEDVRLPEDHLLVKNDGLPKAEIVFYRLGKLLQAAKNIGVGQDAFDTTAAWVQEHVQGGKILIKHQAVAARVADMKIKLEAVRSFLFRVAYALDRDDPEALNLCNMLKVFAANEVIHICRQGLELHGGYGSMMEMGYEKLMRDALMFPHMDGSEDLCAFRIIKKMFPDTAGTYAGGD
ncbi:MAG TPA: acyl-CoA dehydrogenase family protein [Rhodospirillales bacterium]|jgi:hypothetical protein|nr:acyl-CoA dehydrogenase family protein [Rhodospirillales bacterium]HJO86897.1 acyl-CoA dehydrogenase family protein [Rhodospirillales bacterium]